MLRHVACRRRADVFAARHFAMLPAISRYAADYMPRYYAAMPIDAYAFFRHFHTLIL